MHQYFFLKKTSNIHIFSESPKQWEGRLARVSKQSRIITTGIIVSTIACSSFQATAFHLNTPLCWRYMVIRSSLLTCTKLLFQFDRAKSFYQFAKLSYDETNRRAREIEEVAIGSEKDYYDVLYLHNIVSMKFITCQTSKRNVYE